MSTVREPEVQWSQDQMIEVRLREPDDFLKVRETLTRIGVASRKEKKYISRATSYISKDGILSFTLRNCLRWMVNTLTLLLTMFSVGIVLLSFFLIGDSLR